MYHDIALVPLKAGTLDVDRFEQQMQLLKHNGFHVLGMDTYLRFMLEKGTVPDNAVLITFDDGYESFYKLAYPILKRYGYPAVNFVIVSAIDDPALPGVAKLTWEQMREMQKDGMGFYSHTYEMHHYGAVNAEGAQTPVTARAIYDKKKQRKETEAEYAERVTLDLIKAEERLREELGNTDGVLAFPYGAYNEALLKLTEEAGIAITFTTKEGLNSRLNKVGNRINGAKSGESAEDLIGKIKQLSEGSERSSGANIVFVDGEEAADIRLLPVPAWRSDELMIPLRDVCQHNGWTITWNKAQKQIVINTHHNPEE
ncbi:peptidoglycan/xylan/chitin deacetylase (PgdA/CDA1 family) [Paenibacillus castaneae]|uniref:polysaccharide deacetylase family protein n=1 Tax=Paenibacillus castaneae TaxID=474957 RepID=UPI000C9AAD9F|nr:polysaccharide deacetylase family protein [Paenibacillus castaneae]NIK78456.1 peptidoglycan/xylan/chitin deacetylase (PgdA/CDA1 family) [Paenibacillus castaneae]